MLVLPHKLTTTTQTQTQNQATNRNKKNGWQRRQLSSIAAPLDKKGKCQPEAHHVFSFLLALLVCCVCCGEHGTGCAWTGWACLGTGSIPCACLQVCDRRHSTVTICPLVGLLSSRSVCVCVCLRVCVCCGYLPLPPPPGPPPVWQKSNKACSILTCCLFRRACPFSQPKRISSQVLQPLLLVEQAYNLVLAPRLTKPFSPPLYLSIHNASCWLSFV